MKLHTLVERYIALQRSLGKSYTSPACRLRSLVRTVGPDLAAGDLTRERVLTYLTPEKPLTRNYHIKYSSVRGFCRYAHSRGYLKVIPLPAFIIKLPSPFQPHIYTHEELHRVLTDIDRPRRTRSEIAPITMRTIILLLYGSGLRISEALNLDYKDVDLEQSLITVRSGKCFHSRLVPVSASLCRVLSNYVKRPFRRTVPRQLSFFTRRNGQRINSDAVRGYFRRICERAAVRRRDGMRQQPRLHDLRHTFAVHRLTSWYRQGADVQTMLTHLCVYLGHVNLAATQVYLSMTPELLSEANARFERYAANGDRR